MARLIAWLRLAAGFVMPAYLAALVAIAVHGAFAPWEPAAATLARHPGQTPVMVGVISEHGYADTGYERRESRLYLLLPSALTDPRVVIVTEVNESAIVERRSRTGGLLLLAWTFAAMAGTWWIWIRRPRLRRSRAAHR